MGLHICYELALPAAMTRRAVLDLEVLDAGANLGVAVTVRDETGYHEHRDEARLLETVHEWNRLIARLAGKLSDATDPHALRVASPIFAHPRFEHLEGGTE